MSTKAILVELSNLAEQIKNLASRDYGERAEKALSETARVEHKEDSSIEELDAGLADATYMLCELMKGE